jgi:alpha-glucosidase
MSNRFPYILGIVFFILLTARSLTAQNSNYSFNGDYKSHSLDNSIVQVSFDGGFMSIRYYNGIGFQVQYSKEPILVSESHYSSQAELLLPQLQENQDRLRVSASNDVLIIHKKPIRLQFEHQNGQLYLKESFGAGWNQNKPIQVFDKDKQHFLYATQHEQNLGQAVLGLSSNHTWAIFYENSSTNRVELGSSTIPHWGFSAEGGELQFTFVTGSKPADTFKKYRLYKGASLLPPQWALGFHRILQGDATSQDIIDYSLSLQKSNLPIDVVHLNHSIFAEGVSFTWDGMKVPDAYTFADELLSKGIRLVLPLTSTFPNQSSHHFINEGYSQGIFYTTSNSDSSKTFAYSPTQLKLNTDHPSAIVWWKAQLEKKLNDKISGFSISESLQRPNDRSILDRIFATASNSPETGSKHKNLLTSLTSQALSDLQLKQRALVFNDWVDGYSITKSHYTKGRNIIDQKSLDVSVVDIIDNGILGYPGSMMRISEDVMLDKSQYQQAMSLAAFMPGIAVEDNVSKRLVSQSDPLNDHQVLLRQYAALRYHFSPMIFTAWWQHTQEASPVIRPSWWFGIDQVVQITDHFYVGDHLWYTPKLGLSQIDAQKDLPKGMWYHYFTKKQLTSSTRTQIAGQTTTLHQNDYKSMALFARAGAVIPTREISDYLYGRESKELSINVFAGASETSYLYEDDGSSIINQNSSRILQFKTENHSRGFRITAKKTGDFNTANARFSYLIHGLPKKPDRITVNGRNIVYFYEPTTNTIIFKISAGETDIQIFYP